METRISPILTIAFTFFAATIATADDWKPLFDGKSFDGWKQLGGQAEYTIENGEIVGRSVADTPNSFLTTEKTYTDFVLEFEFWVQDGLNSGVQFRSMTKPDPDYSDGRVYGYQYELDTSERAWTAGIYDEANRGWLYPVEYNPSARSLFKNEKWNQARIECVGSEVQTFLNGRQVSHLVDERAIPGFIGLQVHSIRDASLSGYQVRWRKLRINTNSPKLSRSEEIYVRNVAANTLSKTEKDRGWKFLFDGKRTSAWRGISDTNPFHKDGWIVENGALTIQPGGNGGQIITKKTYGAFELDFDFRLTKGANSGVKYFVVDHAEPGSGKSKYLGLEYQVLDDEVHPDGKKGAVGNRTTASLYDLIPPYRNVNTRDVPLHIGKWNHGRIVSHPNGAVEHWLNGFKVVEYERGTNIYDALIARSKYAEIENFGLSEKGHILLQDHNDLVSYRSIKIREL